MLPWAYIDDLSDDRITIDDSEAHHLLNVLRLKTGAAVTLFDGSGKTAEAGIVNTTRRDLTLEIRQRTCHVQSSRPKVSLAVAPPKGDRLKWMIEKLTEIGIDELILLECTRSVSAPGETRIDKLKANVVAACKQSRRPCLMQLQPLKPFSSVVTEGLASGDLFIAHPSEQLTDDSTAIRGDQATMLIGPEGGFTDAEATMALQMGAIPACWPETILRIETAAVVFGAQLLNQAHTATSHPRTLSSL